MNNTTEVTTKANRLEPSVTSEQSLSSAIDKIHSGENIIAIAPGQVFITQDNRLTAQNCWLLFCEYAPDDYEDPGTDEDYLDDQDDGYEYCVPLLPKEYDVITATFIRQRFQNKFDLEFMQRQNKTYNTNVDLKKFLRYMPEFTKKEGKLNELIKAVSDTVSCLKRRVSRDTSYSAFDQTHFYVTDDPEQNLLLLYFEGSPWRPDVHCFANQANADTRQKWHAHYSNLHTAYDRTSNVDWDTIDDYFAECSKDTIDAFGEGATNLAEVQRETGPQDQAGYCPTTHAKKVIIAPTFWYQPGKDIQMSYDFLGKWRSHTNGQISLKLGVFRAWHAPNHPGKGLFTHLT